MLGWCNQSDSAHGRRGREAGIGVFIAVSASERGQGSEAGRVSDTVALPHDQVMPWLDRVSDYHVATSIVQPDRRRKLWASVRGLLSFVAGSRRPSLLSIHAFTAKHSRGEHTRDSCDTHTHADHDPACPTPAHRLIAPHLQLLLSPPPLALSTHKNGCRCCSRCCRRCVKLS